MAIGGLLNMEDGKTITKVPLLGDIPVLGNLFKTQNKVSNRKELLIFITPRIVSDALTLR